MTSFTDHRLKNLLKPVDNLSTTQKFSKNYLPSNSQLSSFVSKNNYKEINQSSSTDLASMIYLCRFRQRNRLIEIPITNEFDHGITHEYLKQLIIDEFQLQQFTKTTLIIQLWNEHYQEYIDIESFKRIPFEGRLQVLIEKDANAITKDSPLVTSKSPSTPVSSHMISTTARSNTPTICPTELEASPQTRIYDESMSNYEHSNIITYDLLPKPTEGIPIPRFPPHIAAFLNGNGDANQLNALVQALYQEIVKYELYPNADELRSIVSRLVDRYPHCLTVIGSIELLVRKLYYKFCNERKKYPVELKRRQPNKRKRLLRDDDLPMINNNNNQAIYSEQGNHLSSLDHLMHLWTNSTTTKNEYNSQQSPTSMSNSSSSPNSNNHEEKPKFHPLNLSISTNNNLMCTE